jgi:hypothetical protein
LARKLRQPIEQVRYSSLTVNLRALLLSGAVFLSACQNMPEPYAPPEQRQPFEKFRPYRITRVVNMADGDAEAHFVSGITDVNGGSWRWTGKRPTVRLTIHSNENLTFLIDFAIAGTTFEQTGPVNVSFFVNDHQVGSLHCAMPGDQHFEAKVPPEVVEANRDVIVAAEIDKTWAPPQNDGPPLGFILTRIGLKQE